MGYVYYMFIKEFVVYLEFKLTEHCMFLFAKFGNSRWGDFRQDDDGTAQPLKKSTMCHPKICLWAQGLF